MSEETLKFILTLLGGATFGAIIAGLFAVFNAWRMSVRETQKWHREQKMDAYVNFLEDVQRFIHAFARFHSLGPVILKDAKEAGKTIRNEKLLVVASAEVRQAQRELGLAVVRAREYLDRFSTTDVRDEPRLTHLSTEMAKKRDAFLVAIQNDLKLPVGQALSTTE
ncbi:hypothetical protein [Arthrobacter sp. NPDC056727]|uniref:hypothetical protein n=1 Tax=Arthrobacter sp. NPDC056727 TaxID=3345927 RepID=UPI00366FCADF